MAGEERLDDANPRRGRAPENSASPPRGTDRPGAAGRDENAYQEPPRREGPVGSAAAAARTAAAEVAGLTGRQVETVISIEHSDDGWKIGVEVVETHRIPDSADILAVYDVRLDADSELVSYRRTRRYARGQLHREDR